MKNPPSSAGLSESVCATDDLDPPFSRNPRNELAQSVRVELHDSLDSIQASRDLEQKLRTFIVQCETGIGLISETDEKRQKIQLLQQSEIHLMHALGDFYESLDHLVSLDIDLDPSEVAKLSQVRSLISPDLLNRILSFYQSFEASLSPVLRGAAKGGAGYFMNSQLSHSETAADDIERLLKSMHDGNQALADMAQRQPDNGLSTVDHEGLMRKMNSVLPKRKRQSGAAEGLAYSMFSSELGQQMMLGLKNESPEALKNMLLDQIQMNLSGMRRGLADQVLPVFGKEEAEGKSMRILARLEPAKQMELCYHIVNMSMGFARNARIQKALLSPSGQSETARFGHSQFHAVR